MFNSNRGRAVAGPAGLVDVVDRSPRKKAQQIWVLVGVITGLAAALIASESMHPILAGAAGVLAGIVLGGVCAAWVYVWPFVRFVWWWSFEISALILTTAGWMQLVEHTTLPVRAAVVAVVVGVPAAVRPIRRRIWAVVLCVAMRHRIRKCFTDYIISDGSTRNRSSCSPSPPRPASPSGCCCARASPSKTSSPFCRR